MLAAAAGRRCRRSSARPLVQPLAVPPEPDGWSRSRDRPAAHLPETRRSPRTWSRSSVARQRAEPIIRIRWAAACSAPAAPRRMTELRAAAGPHRRGACGRARPGGRGRLHRQPADPHGRSSHRTSSSPPHRAEGGRQPWHRGSNGDAEVRVAYRRPGRRRADRSNGTPEGREQNRRIEVVLHRPGVSVKAMKLSCRSLLSRWVLSFIGVAAAGAARLVVRPAARRRSSRGCLGC